MKYLFCYSNLLLAAIISSATPVFVAPLAAKPALEAYGNLPDFEDVAISPSGNHVAMIATVNEARTLIMMEGTVVIRKMGLSNAKVRAIEWASDDILMLDTSQTEKLYGFSTDKAELYRTFVISTKVDSKPEIVFAKQKEIASATFGWYGVREHDGRIYGYFGGVPMTPKKEAAGFTRLATYVFEGGPPALYRVDLQDMSVKQIAARMPDNENRSWEIDANGKVVATLQRRDGSGDWKILNADDKRIAEGSNPLGGIALLAFGYTGDTLIYRREDESTGAVNYFEVPLTGGESRQVFTDVDIARFYTDQRSGRLQGYRIEGRDGKTVFFDPLIDKKVGKIAKAFPKLNRRMIDWSRGFAKVALHTDGNEDSGTYWKVDLEQLAASPLGNERQAIGPEFVGKISTVAYKAADGLEMDGILTLPFDREAKSLPVIMLPHGGPSSHDTESFDWWAQAFASRGYAVFQPNFRGSTNRDAAFLKAGYGEWGRKMQTDISDGLAQLAAQGIVDPKRSCIVGASYGGYAALAGVTLQQGVYRCAVSVAGVSDLSMMVSTDIRESGNDTILKRNLKKEIGSGRDLKDVSPRRLADKADAPVLLIHGKDDVVVPYKQSVVMADALKDAGKAYEFVTLEGEDHWLSLGATRLKMLQETVKFVEQHNPPEAPQ